MTLLAPIFFVAALHGHSQERNEYPLQQKVDGAYEAVANVEPFRQAGKVDGTWYSWLASEPSGPVAEFGSRPTYTDAQKAANEWEKFEKEFARFAGHEQRYFVRAIVVHEKRNKSIRSRFKEMAGNSNLVLKYYKDKSGDLSAAYKTAKRLANPKFGDGLKEYEENVKDAEARSEAVARLGEKIEAGIDKLAESELLRLKGEWQESVDKYVGTIQAMASQVRIWTGAPSESDSTPSGLVLDYHDHDGAYHVVYSVVFTKSSVQISYDGEFTGNPSFSVASIHETSPAVSIDLDSVDRSTIQVGNVRKNGGLDADVWLISFSTTKGYKIKPLKYLRKWRNGQEDRKIYTPEESSSFYIKCMSESAAKGIARQLGQAQ